jgi:xanthine dehydrogenase accessory factor
VESLDLRVLSDALQWRSAGHAVALVTVVETWGSAPRPPGAMLAVRGDGVISGSVSGGCVEDDLIAQSTATFHSAPSESPAPAPRSAKPSMLAYGVTREEASRFGLPCGGTLRLVREQLLETGWVEDLLTRTAAQGLVERRLTLSTGMVSLHAAARGQAMHFDGSVLSTVFGPKWRLLLIGAGQLSQAVARMAQMLDFEVLECDPREEYATTLRMDEVTCMAGMPDDVVRALVPDAHTAIVALTHDPKLDDMALLEALQSDAFYVGALGSRRNQQARKKRLVEHFDMSRDALDRLHGPVGLFIGARTPSEIAVSIVAQIIQVKNSFAAQPVSESAACQSPLSSS